MTKITVDFETQSEVNLKKAGAWEYSVHPTTKSLCFGIKAPGFKCALLDYYQMQMRFKELPSIFQHKWVEWILGPYLFNAHNATFEQSIYYNVLVERLGWPNIPPIKWRCTAAKAAAVAIPRNLADAGAVMNLRVQKDFEGHRIMMKLCKPTKKWTDWKKQLDKYEARGAMEAFELHAQNEPVKFYTPETNPEEFQKLYHYCKVDLITEELLDEALPDLFPSEQKLWFLDQRINFRGVNTDKPLIEKISRVMAAESKKMNKELDSLTMGLVSSGNARDAILDFLWLEEIPLPDLRAKTVDDFLKNGKVTGDAKKLLKLRQALSKASTAKYNKFLIQAASDGRVRDIMLFHGASTGRWSGKGIQPQNFPRGIIKDILEAIERIKTCDLEDLKMLYGENLMPLFSSVLRGMFIATPGHDLFVEDLNAIECRVLWWLANHQKGLDMFRRNEDPYVDMAAAIFNIPLLNVDENHQRQVGKAAVLGCGYQMGYKKFKTAAWDVYRADVDKDMAKVAVTEYRKKHWPVTELWDNYNQACILAIKKPGRVFKTGRCRFFVDKSFLWVELPSGRRLAYKDPSVVIEDVYIEGEGEIVGSQYVEGYGEVTIRDDTRIFEAEKIRYWAVNMKAKKIDTTIPKWSREATYGGKLAENITQAVSRDVLANGMAIAEREGFSVLMHSHDELVSEAPIGKFELEFDSKGNKYSPHYRKIIESPPAWGEDLPLKAGGWAGDRYRKG